MIRISGANSTLHRHLSSRLERQQKSYQPRNNKQRRGNVNWNGGIEIGIQRDDGGHDSKNSVCSSGDGVASPTVLGGEQLGGDGVQYAVHDAGCEAVAAVPAQQGVGRTCGGAGKEEDSGKG